MIMDATSLPNDNQPENSDEIFDSVCLPGLSVEKGLRMCNGSQALYRMVLEQFLATKTGIAAEVRAEVAGENIEIARRMVHSMKSVAGTIGALDLYSNALNLEQALIKREERESLEGHLTAFEQEMKKILSGLKDWFLQKEGLGGC
jgi:two-component system, sensor histidine kinase and response regulator